MTQRTRTIPEMQTNKKMKTTSKIETASKIKNTSKNEDDLKKEDDIAGTLCPNPPIPRVEIEILGLGVRGGGVI